MTDTFTPSPFGEMLNFYAEQSATDSIWPYMEVCGRTGLLYSDATTFIMARPVDSSLPIEDLNSLRDTLPDYKTSGLTDAWHIIYASGDISQFVDKAPYPLPNVMWQRNGGSSVKIFSFNKLKKRTHGIKT